MLQFVFDPFPQASLAVEGTSQRFPVRRVFCVGRNYGAHAKEMGHDPDREPPFFFTKPADAV
ncbi:MAG TPA: FAA hydrolase family protein, partial [Rhizobiales bacterium]|nr:FAA hydrolase family protein [Hyphomicrobiales bacterium]